MKIPVFSSSMASELRSFVALRQSLGYNDRGVVGYLAHFDRYLAARAWGRQVLTRQLVQDWLDAEGPLTASARANRLHALRLLGRFLAETEPETYIPGPTWNPSGKPTFRPYIYTQTEINALLTEAACLTPHGSLRPRTYVTLFGLLYCTGLRISEALALQLRDVDLDAGELCVRESKFRKSRLVPLQADAKGALARYREERDGRGHAHHDRAPFFVNEHKRCCGYPRTVATFLEVARRVGIRKAAGTPGPRLHDFRHTFAVHRLLAWYRDGGDVQARLPLLATYLGHVSIVSTQTYLEVTAELLAEAGRRFRPPRLLPPPALGGAS